METPQPAPTALPQSTSQNLEGGPLLSALTTKHPQIPHIHSIHPAPRRLPSNSCKPLSIRPSLFPLVHQSDSIHSTMHASIRPSVRPSIHPRGGALFETMTFNRRVVGSTPA